MDFENSISNSIPGIVLKQLWLNSNIIELLFDGKVVFGASTALKAIEDFYGLPLTSNGNNIAGIKNIRDSLFLITQDKKIINSLCIIAPHTHWKKKEPVIYTYDKNNNIYIIGPQTIANDVFYTPVSFVFGEKYLIPYEWVDSTVAISELEWRESYNLANTLYRHLHNKNIPLGIAINFRFRKSLFDTIQPSLEVPSDKLEEDGSEGFSYITNESVIEKSSVTEITEQVSWNTISDLFYDFSIEEKEIEQHLQKLLLSTTDLVEREQAISEIYQKLI